MYGLSHLQMYRWITPGPWSYARVTEKVETQGSIMSKLIRETSKNFFDSRYFQFSIKLSQEVKQWHALK
jgi:hypothetical protein